MAFDLLLRGGTVYDGLGSAGVRADVAVQGGRVVAVEPLAASVEGAEVLHVDGLAVTPGFVDSHIHSDFAPLLPASADDARLANLRQGVTTDVCGNCGFSPFPVLPERRDHVAAQNQSLLGVHASACADFSEFEELLEGGARPVNLAALTGHNTLRAGVMGDDNRAATADELRTMQALLARALGDGSIGFSSGLIYPPGTFAGTDELVALASVAAAAGKPYTTHMRNEANEVDAAVEETLEIARRSGAAAHVSHLKVAGRPNWGRAGAVVAALEAARTSTDITADAYPYSAGSTGLSAMLPPWVSEGGIPALLERVASPSVRDRVRRDIETGVAGWPNPVGMDGWESVVVAGAPATPEAEGVDVPSLGGHPVDSACDLLLANAGAVTVVIHAMSDDDVDTVLAQPWVAIGSDAIPIPGRPHPRIAGAFARVLGHYSRERGLLDLPSAIRRMTSDTAARFGLVDRGVLAPGSVADIAVFNPSTVIDRATYADPLLPPGGVEHVIVSGRVAIRGGVDTGVRAGRLLRV